MNYHYLHYSPTQLLRLAHSVEAGFTRQLPQEGRPSPIFFHDPFAATA
jgi:hypothetical protein